MRKGTLLAIVAHPDDETFGCGGSLALHSDLGFAVNVLCLTYSTEERKHELQTASKALVIEEPIIFDRNALSEEKKTVTRISDTIVSTQPEIVITHLAFDYHQEHRLASKLVKEAIEWAAHATTYSEPWRVDRLLQMEVNTLIPTAQIIVDITEVFERKMEAIECYQSQLAKLPDGYYQRFNKLKAKLRGVQGDCRYAEAFIEEPLTKNSPFYRLKSTSNLFGTSE
ncbi:MAG: PIG-L deacetylase family protein [Candidatus Bathyarchaeia archaeon]